MAVGISAWKRERYYKYYINSKRKRDNKAIEKEAWSYCSTIEKQ
jgi:hypothetical protein